LSDVDQLVNMSSKAYDAYLHLRSGYIIPWQDAHTLNVNTTFDLQQSPIDILINPVCFPENRTCQAFGSYVNDDGFQLNTTSNVNNFTFSYSQDIDGTALFFNIIKHEKATNYGRNRVNANDAFGSI